MKPNTEPAWELARARERMVANRCGSEFRCCLLNGHDWRTPMCPRCTAICLIDELAALPARGETT